MTHIPLPPHSSARREELFERLLDALGAAGPKQKPLLAIKDRTLGDPTIALLDAWAATADVLGFYLDRIADEGYISTATEPGSILALAGLAGHRPGLGVAARVHLAYQLALDPDDKAVLLPSGLLSQTVPGPGEQPQIFETTDPLVARPSWGRLAAKRARPLSVATPEEAAGLKTIVVAGTTTNLTTNDTIMLHLAHTHPPALRRIASAEVDITAGKTTLALQPAPPPAPPAEASAPPPGAEPPEASAPPPGAEPPEASAPQPGEAPPTAETEPPADAAAAIDALIDAGLAKKAGRLPDSVNARTPSVGLTFGSRSDATPRLLTALQPALAPILYQALASSPIGRQSVTGASALRVNASPFGAQAPPIQRFDERGQPAGSDDWPIGDTHTLTLKMSGADFGRATQRASTTSGSRGGGRLTGLERRFGAEVARGNLDDPVVDVSCRVGELSRQAVIDLAGDPPWTAELDDLGRVELTVADGTLNLSYKGGDTAQVKSLDVAATLEPKSGAVSIKFDGDASHSWIPGNPEPVNVRAGTRRLSIESTTQVVGTITQTGLDLRIETPLPLPPPERVALPLDGVYEGILEGSTIVIERTNDAGVVEPQLRNVTAVKTITANRYGMSAKITELTLDDEWIGESDLTQASLRALTIRGQLDPLELDHVPITDEDVGGAQIELDGLIAGMEAGRLIIVRGLRTDLPSGATVEAAEVAMIARVGHEDRSDGDTTHTTLELAAPLTYTYGRDSVQIYGNVVAARQGATIHEVLGSGDPAQRHQSFTLSSAPLLADPASTSEGSTSTLTVTVDGVGYAEVARFDDATAPRSFLTAADSRGHTTIVFAAPLPEGTQNVHASYRAGDGSQGNARAGQVSQLLSRPAAVADVFNPLPGKGGRAGDAPEVVRSGVPTGLRGLGRIVSVSDYADRALAWSGVGKASAELTTDGRHEHIALTIAATEAVALDPHGALCTSISATLAPDADAVLPVEVVPAGLFMIVLGATVTHDPLVGWDETVDSVRAALLQAFGYANRELGQDVARGDLIAAAHRAPAVRSFAVTALALVPASVTASDLAVTLPKLLTRPVAEVVRLQSAAADWPASTAPGIAVAFLSDAVPDTLILREARP